MKSIVRTLAFISKEIQSVAVQPQLLLLLILGPFLMLLIFGLGYRPQDTILRTIVVQPTPTDPSQAIGFYLSTVGPPIHVVAMMADQKPALEQLRAHKVDLVAVVPPDAQSYLLAGQNVHLVFYHNAIDPLFVGYMTAVIDGATSQLNKAITRRAIGQQQASAADYAEVLRGVQSDLADMRSALQRGDRVQALLLAQKIRLNAGLVASLWLFSAKPIGDSTAPAAQLSEDARTLSALLAEPSGDAQAVDRAINRLQDDVERMLQVLDHMQRISPDVLVSPLTWEAKGINKYQPSYVAFHSPTVLALLVQHLCITLAALSLVDERNAGAFDLFRVAPVLPWEVLVGKFIAYVILISATVAALVLLLIYGLRVPMLGDWRGFIIVMGALIAHSLSLGFLISAFSRSRSQAIQMSMLALLASIFFSGFFSPIGDFALPVRAISYSLPVTYGIEELRRIVLLGEPPRPLYVGTLAVWAVSLGFVSVRSLRGLFAAR